MKQFTTIDHTSFQAITTLETECCRCHAITRHVAHASTLPPYDKGLMFEGGHKIYIEFDRIINQQAEVMRQMQNGFDQKSADLLQEIKFLKEVISKLPPQHYSEL